MEPEDATEENAAPEYTTTPDELLQALQCGTFLSVSELIPTTNVNATTTGGDLPLVSCASVGRGELLSKLLAAGADPDGMTVTGLTALAAAATNAHLVCVTKLLQGGASINLQGGTANATPLILAARNGHRAVVEALLEAGADASLEDAYGDTAADAAHRYESECRLYAHEFQHWEGLVNERAAVINAEPPPPPLFPLNPLADLERFYRSQDPTKMLWRPGAWVHMKRPAAGPTVVQQRPRAFDATGYAVTPPVIAREHSVFPAEQYAFGEQLEGLQGLSHWSQDATALTGAAAIARERTVKNPQMFNDDVKPTEASTRSAIVDAAQAFEVIKRQEDKLSEAFTSDEVPLRIGNAPTYSSGLQRATSKKAVTAAISLYPVLEPLPEQSLSSLILAAVNKQAATDEGDGDGA